MQAPTGAGEGPQGLQAATGLEDRGGQQGLAEAPRSATCATRTLKMNIFF